MGFLGAEINYQLYSILHPHFLTSRRQHSIIKFKQSLIIYYNMLEQATNRSRYHYSADELSRYFTFPKENKTTLTTLLAQIATNALSAIAAHQLIYALQAPKKQNTLNPQKKLITNLQTTRRPIQHTFTVFTTKLLLDFWNERKINPFSQYTTGGIAGLIGYLISRPLDQIDTARNQILLNEKKFISRVQAIGVILRHDGVRGFYRSENIFGPLCGAIYRSVYFGSWAKLQSKAPIHNQMIDFVLIPFFVSLSASIATAIPDKLRSFGLNLNESNRRSLERVYGKKATPKLKTTSEVLVQFITSKQFTFNRRQVALIGYAVLKNWLVLMAFAIGQQILRQSEEKEQLKQQLRSI